MATLDNVSREGTGVPTWGVDPLRMWVMSDKLTLVDESRNFRFAPLQVRDNARYLTHYPDPAEFHLLKYFALPREEREVEAWFHDGYRRSLPPGAKADEPLTDYMARLIRVGLVRPTNERFTAIADWKRSERPIVFEAPHNQRHDKRIRGFAQTLAINLTERCNLACRHCSVSSNPYVSTKNDLTKEELFRIFDECDEANLHTLRLTGGEPTIRPDFWEIFERALEHRFHLVLFTNGTRLNKDNILRLKDAQRRKGSRFMVHVSIDGGTPQSHDYLRNMPGNFERVVRAMELLHEHGVRFYGESVLHERSASYAEIAAMASLLHRNGATYLSIHPGEMIGTGETEKSIFFTRERLKAFGREIRPLVAEWAAKGLEISFSSYTFPIDEPEPPSSDASLACKPKPGADDARDEAELDARAYHEKFNRSRGSGFNVCTAGISQAAISATGDVFGCPRYVGAKQFALGNVRQRPLIDIWNDPGWDWVRADYRPKLRLCNDCKFVENCFYGKTCRANPGYLFNDEYGVSPECILEYRELGLPYEKVVGYLRDRIAENSDNLRVRSLCETLLEHVQRTESSVRADETGETAEAAARRGERGAETAEAAR